MFPGKNQPPKAVICLRKENNLPQEGKKELTSQGKWPEEKSPTSPAAGYIPDLDQGFPGSNLYLNRWKPSQTFHVSSGFTLDFLATPFMPHAVRPGAPTWESRSRPDLD